MHACISSSESKISNCSQHGQLSTLTRMISRRSSCSRPLNLKVPTDERDEGIVGGGAGVGGGSLAHQFLCTEETTLYKENRINYEPMGLNGFYVCIQIITEPAGKTIG